MPPTSTGGLGLFFVNIIGIVRTVIGLLTPIAVSIAVLMFFYQIIMYIKSQGTEKAQHMKGIWYSLLAIFIMLAFFGIINIVSNAVLGQGQLGGSIGASVIPCVDTGIGSGC